MAVALRRRLIDVLAVGEGIETRLASLPPRPGDGRLRSRAGHLAAFCLPPTCAGSPIGVATPDAAGEMAPRGHMCRKTEAAAAGLEVLACLRDGATSNDDLAGRCGLRELRAALRPSSHPRDGRRGYIPEAAADSRLTDGGSGLARFDR